VRDVCDLAGLEVIYHIDFMTAVYQGVHQVGANIASPAGYQYPHVVSLRMRCDLFACTRPWQPSLLMSRNVPIIAHFCRMGS
jgi:hypothetical protein